MESGILKSIYVNKWKAEDIYSLFSQESQFAGQISQGKTGYCWLIAVLHQIIYYMQKKFPEADIVFSAEYLVFYDKLEKANLFLSQILNTLQLPDGDRTLLYLLNHAMTDEGQWQMAENLICKYGLVPMDGVEKSITLKPTGELNASISFLLRFKASEIREKFQKGADYSELMSYKENVLAEVEGILIKNYGMQPKFVEVPQYFTYERQTVSPLSFFEQYIKFPFKDYISVIDCGENSDLFYTNDLVELDGNVIEGKRNSFLHISGNVFYKAIYEQVRNGQPCWAGCDAGKFHFLEYGIYDDTTFDLSDILGVDFEQKITKKIIIQYKMASASHALLLYDVTKDENGMLWWKAQNSIQNTKTGNGNFYLSDHWLKKYLFYAVVNCKYIPVDPEKKTRVVKPWELFMLA